MRFLPKNKLFFTTLAMVFAVTISYAQEPVTTPVAEGKVRIKQDPRIDRLMNTKKDMFKNDEITVYRIQIYNGSLKGAEEALEDFENDYEDWHTDISFETPNYKVRVGRFRTRLEADRMLMKVKKTHPSAFLLEPR